MSETKAPLKVGVLLLSTVQLLDASSVDLFSMLEPAYLSIGMPALAPLGNPVEITYIHSSGAGSLAPTTAKASIHTTAGLTDAAARPGSLDILFIPGPDPRYELSEQEKAFIKGHWGTKGVVLMTVCTGIYAVAQAGIVAGRAVTGPRELVPDLKKRWPSGEWTEKRWAVDLPGKGKERADLWTSGESFSLDCCLEAWLTRRSW